MSYVFYLFNLPYPQQDLQYNLEAPDLKRDGLPLSEKDRADQERFIAQILDVNPAIKIFRHKTGTVINLAEEPDRLSGTQIELEKQDVTVSIPYWYSGEIALNLFHEIWKILDILQAATGYLVYDNQLDKTLKLASDFQEVYERYTILEQLRTAK